MKLTYTNLNHKCRIAFALSISSCKDDESDTFSSNITDDIENENKAYDLDTELSLDRCSKYVNFNFIITNVDTF
ncbi:MAG: hypothetical protein ACI94Y_003911 [Maribacter sp.]|jgi:hypothetical protein